MATTEDYVAAVKAMVEEDARVTVAQFALDLGISSGSDITILHEKLSYSKVCARWVPHMLTEDQKRVGVDWCGRC